MAGSEGAPEVQPPAGGQRGGARRAAKPKRSFQPQLALLGLAALLALVAWGALVWVAIGYGRDARSGDSGKWVLLIVTSLVAVGMLVGSLYLFTLLLRKVGILDDPRPKVRETSHKH